MIYNISSSKLWPYLTSTDPKKKKRERDKSIKRKAIKLQETEMREIRDALHFNLNKKYINISTINAQNFKIK